jgi:hypothetical protein
MLFLIIHFPLLKFQPYEILIEYFFEGIYSSVIDSWFFWVYLFLMIVKLVYTNGSKP